MCYGKSIILETVYIYTYMQGKSSYSKKGLPLNMLYSLFNNNPIFPGGLCPHIHRYVGVINLRTMIV